MILKLGGNNQHVISQCIQCVLLNYSTCEENVQKFTGLFKFVKQWNSAFLTHAKGGSWRTTERQRLWGKWYRKYFVIKQANIGDVVMKANLGNTGALSLSACECSKSFGADPRGIKSHKSMGVHVLRTWAAWSCLFIAFCIFWWHNNAGEKRSNTCIREHLVEKELFTVQYKLDRDPCSNNQNYQPISYVNLVKLVLLLGVRKLFRIIHCVITKSIAVILLGRVTHNSLNSGIYKPRGSVLLSGVNVLQVLWSCGRIRECTKLSNRLGNHTYALWHWIINIDW